VSACRLATRHSMTDTSRSSRAVAARRGSSCAARKLTGRSQRAWRPLARQGASPEWLAVGCAGSTQGGSPTLRCSSLRQVARQELSPTRSLQQQAFGGRTFVTVNCAADPRDSSRACFRPLRLAFTERTGERLATEKGQGQVVSRRARRAAESLPPQAARAVEHGEVQRRGWGDR